jgi:hypothetical protein
VRQTDLAALDRQDVPYDRVARAAGLPSPQVMLVHHETAALPGLGAARFEAVPTGALAADLTLSFFEPPGDGAVECLLEYDAGRFGGATARRLADGFADLLAEAVADPSRPLFRPDVP